MTYEDLLWFLQATPALIVHFSHHAKMREGGVYPSDLLAAIANSRVWSLSSCLVTPSHKMSLPGSIGVVLRPRSLSSIVSVKNSDSESILMGGDVEGSLGEPLTTDAGRRSLEVAAGDYNEWRVRDSEVVAVYFEEPLLTKQRVRLEIDGTDLGEEIAAISISLADVHALFVNLPIVTRSPDGTRFMATQVPVSALHR